MASESVQFWFPLRFTGDDLSASFKGTVLVRVVRRGLRAGLLRRPGAGSASTVTLILQGDFPSLFPVSRTIDLDGDTTLYDLGTKGPLAILPFCLFGDELGAIAIGSGDDERMEVSMSSRQDA